MQNSCDIYRQGLLQIIAQPVQSEEALRLIDLALVSIQLGKEAEADELKNSKNSGR